MKDYILNYNKKSLKLMELKEKIVNNYFVIKKGEKRKIYLQFRVPNFNDYEIDYMENYSDTYDYSEIDFSIDILLYDLSKNLYKETLEFKINKNTISSYTLNQEEYYYIYRFNKKNIFPELQESEEV